MAQRSFPFDGVDVNEAEWQDMAREWLATGVIADKLDELEVFGDSSGRQVKVRTGRAWIDGHFYESTTQETLAIGVADPTNPRIDRIVVRADFAANTIVLAVLAGVAGGAPTAPVLTQVENGTYEIGLAQVAVAAAAALIDAGDVTDERSLVTHGYATTGDIAAIADAESAGTSARLARGDHVHSGSAYILKSLLDDPGAFIKASADNTPTKQSIGTALQVLRTNAAEDDIEYADAAVGGMLDYQFAQKTATTSRDTTTTVADDPHLGQAILANEVWIVRMKLSVSAADTPDLKLTIAAPAGASGHWFFRCVTGGTLNSPTSWVNLGANSQTNGNLTAALVDVDALVFNGANPGNISLQWAQAISDAGSVSVNIHSYAEFIKVA